MGKVYYERVWYCHNCKDGPLTCSVVTDCPMCGHRLCGACETVMMKFTSR